MNKLEGKTALVTGAGSGIGKAIACAFASEGAFVGVLDVNGELAADVAAEITAAGGNCMAIHADVSNAEEMSKAFSSFIERTGRLDVLVNNAAIQIMGNAHELTEEQVSRMIDVNFKGVFWGCRYALPIMMEQKKGVILSTSSVLGLVGDPDLSVYGATKGAIIAYTKSLAVAYGPYNIRVNAVCPGDVNTPLVQQFFDYQPDPREARQRVNLEYPLRRIAEPQEVAKVFTFLASDDSSFISGSHVLVDGGLLAGVY